MTLISNPYLVGVLILVFEWTTNFLISKVFGFDLGEHNLSAILFFVGAGYFIAYKTKKKMGRSYNIKVVLTYFAILTIIVLGSFLGQELNLTAILFLFGLFAVLALISYFAITFGQSIFMNSFKKTSGVSETDGNK